LIQSSLYKIPSKILSYHILRGDHFLFGSIFIKKNNQTNFFFSKKEPKPVQTDRFRFGFLEQNRFKPVWLGLGSVRFGFFGFRLIKPNWTSRFFKNFNRFNWFFFTVRFFRLFVFQFSRFSRFFCFFAHPYTSYIKHNLIIITPQAY
jgi:hypothetical protein